MPDLVAHVAAHPEGFVLKRAWDYGGKAVFVGPASGEPGFATRSEAAFGERLDWPELVRARGGDPARWRLRGPGGGGHSRASDTSSPRPGGPVEAEVFVDYSAFASVGLESEPAWGGVVRASASRIVNIQGGGGVLPLHGGVGLGEASPCTPGGILTPPGVL